MGLFKNSVGRPSNETLKKRRNFYILITICIVLLVGMGVVFLKKTFSNLEIEGGSKGINNILKGDVATDVISSTWDGKITKADAEYILKYSVNSYKPSISQKQRADFDGNGKITMDDSRMVQMYALDGDALGDINKDKKHDKNDISLIIEFINGKKKPTEDQKKLSDLDKNGKVEMADRKILEKIVYNGLGDIITDENYTRSDGKITKSDAVAIFKFVVGNMTPTSLQRAQADYDGDGKITISDVRAILKKIDSDEILRETVTVKFNKNAARAVSQSEATCRVTTKEGKESCEIKLPIVTPKEGYTFIGWSSSQYTKTPDIKSNSSTVKVSSNKTVYAIIRSTIPYRASFLKNTADSIGSTNLQCFLYNNESSCYITMPTIKRSGYVILGWSRDRNGKSAPLIKEHQQLNMTGNAVFYAITDNLSYKFPDPNLRKCVLDSRWSVYGNHVDLTDDELLKVTSINCNEKNVKDTTGIQFLVNLEKLELRSPFISSIDLSKNTKLTYITLDSSTAEPNNITKLDLSKNTKLVSLSVSKTKIKSLDLSKNPLLEYIGLRQGQFTTLDISKNPKLKKVDASENNIVSINVNGAISLEYLNLYKNKLNSLKITNAPNLKLLNVSQNNLKNLDIRGATSLEILNLANSNLEGIDLSKNIKLKELDISNSKITKLDLSKNLQLESLYAGKNKLATIDVSKNTKLDVIYLEYNNLSKLDVSKNALLTSLNISGNRNLNYIDLSKNTKMGRVYVNNTTKVETGNNKSIKITVSVRYS